MCHCCCCAEHCHCFPRQRQHRRARSEFRRGRCETSTSSVQSIPPFTGSSLSDSLQQSTLSPSEDVGVAIGLISCQVTGGGGCPLIDPTQELGSILFKGAYNPTGHPDTPLGDIEFYQNFTVTVPSNFATGVALLNVAHFYLVGVSSRATSQVV